MNLQHVRAMARKEWRHLLRDVRSLGLLLLIPSLLLFLFGYAIRLDIRHAPIAIIQESRVGCADALAAHFAAAQAFRVVFRSSDRREAGDALQSGAIWAALIIPTDFACEPQRGSNTVQWLLDGVDANSRPPAAQLRPAVAASLRPRTGT